MAVGTASCRQQAGVAGVAGVPSALGVRVRRRTGRSVSVLFLLLVLAVTGCWPSTMAWPAPWPAAWPAVVDFRSLPRLVGHRLPSLTGRLPLTSLTPRAWRGAWSSWSGWSGNNALERLSRLGGLLGPSEGAGGKGTSTASC